MTQKSKKYDAVLKELPLEDGIDKRDTEIMFANLRFDDALPLDMQQDMSACIGFITTEAAEKLSYDYVTCGFEAFIKGIMSSEEPDGIIEEINAGNGKTETARGYLFNDLKIAIYM